MVLRKIKNKTSRKHMFLIGFFILVKFWEWMNLVIFLIIIVVQKIEKKWKTRYVLFFFFHFFFFSRNHVSLFNVNVLV